MKQLLIIGTVLLLSSCSKFLEPKSQSEYVPRTVEAINEMLIGSAYPESSLDIFRDLNFHDDDIMMTSENVGFYRTTANYKVSIYALFTKDKEKYSKLESKYQNNSWYMTYQKILGANAALDYVEDVKGNEIEKNITKAQALTLRAFYYFLLTNLYGAPYTHNKEALAVPLKLVSGFSDNYTGRNTVEEVYKQIITDLLKAEQYYNSAPEKRQFKKDHRTSLPMVQLLLSRVYLYMGQMSEAANYAEKVIKNNQFSLYDLNSFEASTTHYFPNYATYGNPETIWAYGNAASLNRLITINGYSENGRIVRALFNVSDDLLSKFTEGDLRKSTYFVTEGTLFPNTYIPMGKSSYGLADKNQNFTCSNTTMGMSMRLSEAYLNLAEAVMVSDPNRALKLINTLREKRFTPNTYVELTNVNDLKTLIYEERRRELCFEGHRWFDLRRQGMPSFSREWKELGIGTETITLREKSPYYVLPIDQNIIDKNPSIVQNNYN